MKTRSLFVSTTALGLVIAISLKGQDRATPPPTPANDAPSAILFQNVRVFDGKSSQLSSPSHVLIRGNL